MVIEVLRLPGTIIETKENNARQVFSSIFSTGGVTLSQVCNITELENYIIQNWVKRGYISAPISKKYDENQLCRIIIINVLKDVFSIEQVCAMLDFTGNVIKIEDSALYHLFCEVSFFAKSSVTNFNEAMSELKPRLNCPNKTTEKNLISILEIMFTAYVSKLHKQSALMRFKTLNI